MKKIKLLKTNPTQLYHWTVNQIYSSKLDLRIVKHTSDKQLAIRLLNRISNETCKTADYIGSLLSVNNRLISNVGSSAIEMNSPQSAYHLAVSFMEELNSDQELYQLTKSLYYDFGKDRTQQGLFLRKLVQDFEHRAGLNKSLEERSKISETYGKISELQDALTFQILGTKKEVNISKELLARFSEIPLKIVQSTKIAESDTAVTLRASIQQLNTMFLYNDEAEARNYVFRLISDFDSRSSTQMVAELLLLRSEFANALGYNNYFDYNVANNSIYIYKENPPNVILTIDKVKAVSKAIKEEISNIKTKILTELKERIPKIKLLLSAQDDKQKGFRELLYYRHLLTLRNKSLLSKMHFKLGDVIEFLKFYFRKWFDIEIKYNQKNNEFFGEGVKIIEINAKQAGNTVGTIYLDLFARDGKSQAKQTIALQSHTELKLHPKTKLKQRPIMLITASLQQNHTNTLDCTLSVDEVGLICHELGHCMHNFFSRSNYQFVMGTFPIDYAEMMAILSEKIGELELSLLLSLQHDELMDVTLQKDLLEPIEEFEQLFYALVDLNLHSIQFKKAGDNETLVNKIYKETCEDLNSAFGDEIIPPEMRESAWIFNVEHLVNYGGSYYSYIVANSYAKAIVEKLSPPLLGSLAYQSDESDPFFRFKLKFANLYKSGHSSVFFNHLKDILEIKLDDLIQKMKEQQEEDFKLHQAQIETAEQNQKS